jgi:leucyl/phenylalanyl-tRNA--protein transferase
MPIFRLEEELIFPPPHLASDDGLLAVGGDLSPERLLLAYSMGIFPWFSKGDPLLWWSPSPRLILELHELKISKRLQRTLRQNTFEVTMDTAFVQVITHCAHVPRRHQHDTWITPEMITAYTQLHDLGYAHSVECWQDGKITGGLYGIALGGVFFGESMFSAVADSSKVALVRLTEKLIKWDFDFIDCQIKNDHLLRLGAKEIAGEIFRARLAESIHLPGKYGKWKIV